MRTHIHQAKDGTYEVVDADAYDEVLLKGFIWEEQAITAEKQYLANLKRQGGNATSLSESPKMNKPTTFAIIRKDVRKFIQPPDTIVWRGFSTFEEANTQRLDIDMEHGKRGIYFLIVHDETTEMPE